MRAVTQDPYKSLHPLIKFISFFKPIKKHWEGYFFIIQKIFVFIKCHLNQNFRSHNLLNHHLIELKKAYFLSYFIYFSLNS